MRPQTIGRVLGVGLRVAGRIAGQRLAGSAAQPETAGAYRGAARKAGRVSEGVARGVGGFLRPFRRVGGIILLEVTGAFFLMFVFVFGRMAWQARASYAQGPDHARFLAAVIMGAVFLYLCLSSFWRARRR